MFFVFDSVLNQYKIQEICNSSICEDLFSIKYVSDYYNT